MNTNISLSSKNTLSNSSASHKKNPADFLAKEWSAKLKGEFSKPYMENIRQFLRSEIQKGYRFFPPAEKIFRALKLVDYNDVRVVIIGQDPYHGFGQANGLAFAVEKHIPLPPSLQNIFKEIAQSYGLGNDFKFNRTLEGWAKQGVLCLNTVLTVRESMAFSHRNIGWETFTDEVLKLLLEQNTPKVFLCWGSAASQKLEQIINTNKIDRSHFLILKAPHPSPLSAHRGFLGCQHFIKVNEYLKKHHLTEINWLI